MTAVTRSIRIEAPIERVFALITDPAARSRLNPGVTPLAVEIENGGPLRHGSVCHFRVETGGRLLDYRMRVTEFVPHRRLTWVSDTAVPFETQVELEPQDRGTWLTQTERFEPSDEMLHQAAPDRPSPSVMQMLYRFFLVEHPEAALELRERQERALVEDLGAKLDSWLMAIKQHLENG